jgi:hypothetical protein
MTIETYLQKEQAKIDEADHLTAKLKTLHWWQVSYWQTRYQLHKVVQSFRLCDENYNLRLDDVEDNTYSS